MNQSLEACWLLCNPSALIRYSSREFTKITCVNGFGEIQDIFDLINPSSKIANILTIIFQTGSQHEPVSKSIKSNIMGG